VINDTNVGAANTSLAIASNGTTNLSIDETGNLITSGTINTTNGYLLNRNQY